MLNYKLQNLPPFGKLFVGMTTVLMMWVVFWAMLIFYVDKGLVDEDNLPAYMQTEEETLPDKAQIYDEAELISEDSLSELAPDWDSNFKEDTLQNINPVVLAEKFIQNEEEQEDISPTDTALVDESFDMQEKLRHNIGLAHTHINGQTLLYFVLGFLFLFTSTKDKIKKLVYWIFGIVVFTHAVGLTGEGFHWFFDDLLAISGVTLLAIMPYMCLIILLDLFKNPE